ncbi:Disheveled-associated activator of morphogenesis 1 [Seminavis robusta]|uniref:Disheveled-associated activator of morphogenesis 1 n=1 Tax=Seminavis robusta TaxID=568900 RepID=A0A9N8E5L4_9STRA|nr:Disheveled-associated activator of morphogenesis 1 [Seminavis robusta]|eukprot:Sro644_g180430.1 Disheveled-associated activator of morphogenesis 1 (2238) ;mRNA; f:4092-10887
MFRRRPREPPSTLHLRTGDAPRRRQPIDPPSSIPEPRSEAPTIQLTNRQLDILRQRQEGPENRGLHRLDPSDECAPHEAAATRERDENNTEQLVVDENQGRPTVPREGNRPVAKAKLHQEVPRSTASVSAKGTSSVKSERPFTTRSNKGVSRSVALASKKLSKESRSGVGRSSVFRKRNTSDNDTVVSVSSVKSAATAASGRTQSSGKPAMSDHDKAALRKLLGTGSTENKPYKSTAPAPKPSTKTTQPRLPIRSVASAPAPVPSMPAVPNERTLQTEKTSTESAPVAAPAPAPSLSSSGNDQFDQKEYLRNLISSRAAANKPSSVPKKDLQVSSAASKSTSMTKQSTVLSDRGEGISIQTEKVRKTAEDSSSCDPVSEISAKSSASGASSTSFDQKAILRKVLAKTMTKKGKDKPKRKLSPKSKGTKSPKFEQGRIENAAMTLSRKVLSDQSKAVSPKGPSKGLKGYVRSKMVGLSRKPSRATAKQAGESRDVHNSNLAKTTSSDSADSGRDAAEQQAISQIPSLSSDTGDDDKTRTTASSSNVSESTQPAQETGLKVLETAETMDTDESSTIMGNLQSASSDSMQYSSEEGCEDTALINQNAFRAIDKLSRAPLERKPKSMNSIEENEDGGSKRKQLTLPGKAKHRDQGYNDFVKALQAEASGAHSELWSSFQAVMTGSPRRAAVPTSQFKFDPMTKDMLSAMNAHLKRLARVECVTATQLVNDKRLAKEVAAGLSAPPSASSLSVLAATNTRVVDEEPTASKSLNLKPTAARKSWGVKKEVPLRQGLQVTAEQPGSDGAKEHTRTTAPDIQKPPQNHSFHRNQPRECNAAKEKEDHCEAIQDTSSEGNADKSLQTRSVIEPKHAFHTSTHKTKPDSAIPLPGLLKKPTPPPPSSSSSEKHSSEGKTTVKLLKSRRSSEPTQKLLAAANKPESEATVPWSGVRLRAVSNSGPQSTLQVESQNEIEQGGSLPSPWANVKLRHIQVEEKDSAELEQAEQDQMQENDSLIPVVAQGAEVPSTTYTNLGQPEPESDCSIFCDKSSDAASQAEHEQYQPIHTADLPEAVSNDDDDASTSRPAPQDKPCPFRKCDTGTTVSGEEEAEVSDESAFVFELKGTTAAPDQDQEQVVISKRLVKMLRLKPDESGTTATWSLPRDKIKALKLDMEFQRVNLLLVESNDSKVLSFRDSADCLKFANAFYEMPNPNEHNDRTLKSRSTEDSQDTTSTVSLVESLSHEEQQVLETYRQARRTKPAVDALRTAVDMAPVQDAAPKSVGIPKGASFLNDILKRGEDNDSATHNVSVGTKREPSSLLDKCKLPLAEKELEVAESYQKMLKMMIPPEAVRHKMAKEGVSPKIAAFVLSEAGLLPRDTSFPDDFSDFERQATKMYRSMVELDAPLDDVRREMEKDNVDEKIVSAVLNEDKSSKKSKAETGPKLSEAEEAIASSYRKMLKMMIPEEAVRHKMMKDEIEPKIVAAVLGSDTSSKPSKPQLTPEEERIASKYQKMLKLNVPPEGVRHKMEKEGVATKIINALLGTGTPGSDAKAAAGGSKAAKSKLVSLHWTPLSGEELDNSVWCATTKPKRKSQPARSDISKLVELFQKKSTVKVMKGAPKDGNDDKGVGKAKLLDINRANIIAISLKAFKDFSYDELASILQNVDPLCRLRGERVQFVRDLLPTAAEISNIKRYYGSPDRLVPAELWFQKIVHIKRLDEKAHVLHAMEVFETEAAEIQKSMHLLTRVCTQVMESARLRELLDMVLQIGNIMNEGTRTGGASGFKFDSLLRLTQTKSGDGKTTVLDYMVTIYVAKGQKQTLNLLEDFPDCQAASRMLISDLIANVKEIDEKLQKCKKEHELLVSETGGPSMPAAAVASTASTGRVPVDSRVQSSAISARASETDAGNGNTKSVHASALSEQHSAGPRGNGDSAKKRNDLQSGINRLSEFLTKADQTFASLKRDCSNAVETCREMSKYCGESGGERSTDGLLGILCKFASNLEAAVQKHEKVMEAEAKKAAKLAAAPTAKTHKKPGGIQAHKGLSKNNKNAPDRSLTKGTSKSQKKGTKGKQEDKHVQKTQGKGTSLVLLVNELLKDASEQTKRDFSQGVVYTNPDDKLKAIYERETRGDHRGRRTVESDIISAINKRRQSGEGGESQLERVIDCINNYSATSGPVDDDTSDSTTSDNSDSDTLDVHPTDRFQDLQNRWKALKQTEIRRSSLPFPSPTPSETHPGTAFQPIDFRTSR